VDRAFAPHEAKIAAFYKKIEGMGFYMTESGSNAPPWAFAELAAIMKEQNPIYLGICPQWFGTAGQFVAWLKRYKDWHVQKHIPYMETHDEQTISSYTMLNTPTAAYKSTATMASVKDYLAQSMVVYQKRWLSPRK